MKKGLIACILFQCLTGCKPGQQLHAGQQSMEQAPPPLQYFNTAFDIIRKSYYQPDKADFNKLCEEGQAMARNAVDYEDTYAAIRHVLKSLNDKHNAFIPPRKPSAAPGTGRKVPFATKTVNREYAVLALHSFSSSDIEDQRKVADSLYAFLCEISAKGIQKLVIDLRKMEGGSNAPFLCGLAPLIKPSLLFTYINNRKQKAEYRFVRGTLWREHKKSKFTELSIWHYRPCDKVQEMKVALLTGPYTASAGETIVIAFKGLANCKTFGTATYGVPTGVAVYPLSDGASLALASSVPYDRQGKAYTGPIAPDVPLDANDPDEMIFQVILNNLNQ